MWSPILGYAREDEIYYIPARLCLDRNVDNSFIMTGCKSKNMDGQGMQVVVEVGGRLIILAALKLLSCYTCL